MEFINDSAIGSPFTRYKTDAFVRLDLAPAFTPKGQRKDLRLALRLGADQEVPMPVSSATEVEFSRLVASGLGDGPRLRLAHPAGRARRGSGDPAGGRLTPGPRIGTGGTPRRYPGRPDREYARQLAAGASDRRCQRAARHHDGAVTRQEAFPVSSSTPEQVQAAQPGGDPPPPRRRGLTWILLLATALTVLVIAAVAIPSYLVLQPGPRRVGPGPGVWHPGQRVHQPGEPHGAQPDARRTGLPASP